MKNAIFILSILLFSNTLAFDLGGFSTNSYNYYSPNYGWNNSILGNNKLLNNLRMLGYNSITMPPLNFYSNHYPYPSQYHPFYNNYNNLRKPPRHAHRHPRPFPNRGFNRFNNFGHLTGFSPSIQESLPNCGSGGYYVTPNGAISCRQEVSSSTNVRIIKD